MRTNLTGPQYPLFLTIYTDESQLLAIPGIDPDKVERYGSQFLRLVRGAQRHYEDLKSEQNEEADGVVHDPNHDTVIALTSDDEFSDDGLFADGVSNLDLDSNIASQYFEGELRTLLFNQFIFAFPIC